MKTKKHTSKDVYTHNYYYAQVFTDSKEKGDISMLSILFIIFADSRTEAYAKAKLYLEENTPKNRFVTDTYLYHKNYKIRSKELIEENKYID